MKIAINKISLDYADVSITSNSDLIDSCICTRRGYRNMHVIRCEISRKIFNREFFVILLLDRVRHKAGMPQPYLIEKEDKTTTRCVVCSELVEKDDLRVVFGGNKKVHLHCWKPTKKIKKIKTYFRWALPPSDSDQKKLEEYVKQANGGFKRKAKVDIDDRPVKKMRTEILSDENVWDLNETKIHAPITLMSIEIINMIFKTLDFKSLIRSSMVCRQWLVLATEEDLWQELCKTITLGLKKPDDMSWRMWFKSLSARAICFECKKDQGRSVYFYPLKAHLCLYCKGEEKYALIGKQAIRREYNLKESELLEAGLRPQLVNGRQQCYLLSQVKDLAIKKSNELGTNNNNV